MWKELAWAFRVLRSNPGFTWIAVLTLGLGIGANTAIFSVVHGVLLAPLEFADAGRIVALETRFVKEGRMIPRVTGGDLEDVQRETGIFSALSAYLGGEMGVQLKERAEFTGVFLVNRGFFDVFGVKPVYGRVFEEGDHQQAAVVTAGFAERNLGGAAAAVGKKIHVESWDLEVVGVMPNSFRFPQQSEVWVAMRSKPENVNRTAYNYRAVAKLAGGVTEEGARVRLEALGARLGAVHPDSNKEKTFGIKLLQEQMVGPVRQMLYVLLGAVSLVLLIACANVANLLLARATARSREFAVRVALGAGRWQIVRQLAMENMVLAVLGGLLGLGLVSLSLDVMVRLAPNLPRMQDVTVDRTVLLFTMAVSLTASFLFGLTPALHASRMDVSDGLKQGGGRGFVGSKGNGLRRMLVVAEVSLAVVLAVGAGLLLRSFLSMQASELGYRTEGVLVMYAHAPAKGLEGYVKTARSFQNLFGELKTVPGVKSAAGAMGLPAGRYGSFGMYAVEGKHRFEAGVKLPSAGFRLASPGYFETMGIPLKAGRDFSERDQYEAPFVAIISESMARESFTGEDPVGKRVQCGLDSDKWMTVVGVVGDVRQDSPASRPGSELYMPLQQHPFYANEVQVVLRTMGEPGGFAGAVRERAKRWNPEAAVKFTTMETMVSDSVATPRFRTLLVGLFAGFALVLAMAGTYGVMNYVVTQRTSEFGLRMALGAGQGHVLRLVVGDAVWLAGIGLAAGAAMSFAFHRVLATMLYGLEPADPVTYAGVAGLVCMVTLVAALVPSWRATRIAPVVALRDE